MRPRTSRAAAPTSTLHQPLSRSMNVLSICAGYGGIDLGLRLAVPSARTVCFVEREAAACEILVRRMSEGWLDPAPIWTDATTFDGRPWRGVVDCIAAGIPCQPWSTAGKRKGFEDERHLGEELVRVVDEVGPGLVFVENVSGFVRLGAPDLLGRLANLGYDAQWGMFSAAGVGAPHRRQRVFLLAYRGSMADTGRWDEGRDELGRSKAGTGAADLGADGQDVAHRDSGGLEGERFSGLLDGERTTRGHDADGCHEGVGDPSSERRGEGWSKSEGQQRQAGVAFTGSALVNSNGKGLQTPGPPRLGELSAEAEPGVDNRPELPGGGLGDPDRERRQERDAKDSPWAFPTPFPPGPSSGLWERVDPRAWPAVDDSSSGKHKGIREASRKFRESFAREPSAGSLGRKPQSEIEPGFCRVAHGAPSRVDQLRMLGNGVVPLAAAHAFRTLSSRIHP
jgi:DNA (cytosine-5)-methyltransferase 1